eukprot:scaffold286_cov247-Pinguiococcus_pyrenoidosus.AAC.4
MRGLRAGTASNSTIDLRRRCQVADSISVCAYTWTLLVFARARPLLLGLREHGAPERRADPVVRRGLHHLGRLPLEQPEHRRLVHGELRRVGRAALLQLLQRAGLVKEALVVLQLVVHLLRVELDAQMAAAAATVEADVPKHRLLPRGDATAGVVAAKHAAASGAPQNSASQLGHRKPEDTLGFSPSGDTETRRRGKTIGGHGTYLQPHAVLEAFTVLHLRHRREPDVHVLFRTCEDARVLLGIETQSCRQHLLRRAGDGLAETCNRGQDLLRDVPLHVRRDGAAASDDVLRVESTLRGAFARPSRLRLDRRLLLHLWGVVLVRCAGAASVAVAVGGKLAANHVRDVIAHVDGLAGPEHADGDLDVRLTLRVRIVPRMLVEALRDHVLGHVDLPFPHVLGEVLQMLVDVRHDGLAILPAQDLVQDVVAHVLAELAPVSAHEVQALDFPLGRHHAFLVGVPIHQQRGVLLLLQQEHALVDAIQVDLQGLVESINFPLDLMRQRASLAQVGGGRVDHDGVGVSVDDLKAERVLRQVHGVLERVAALARHERRDGLGIESAEAESQAPVHAVRRELERHLADNALDAAPTLDQRPNHARQDAGRHGVARRVRDLRAGRDVLHVLALVLCRGSGLLVELWPVDGGEAEVVFLDDARVQAVEVQQQDVAVVEALLRLEHQAAGVRGFGALSSRASHFEVAIALPGRVDATARALPALVLEGYTLGHNVLEVVELVQQQELDPLGALAPQRAAPEIPAEVRELHRQRHDLQLQHELLGQERLERRVIRELDNRLAGPVAAGHVVWRQLCKVLIELRLGQVGEGVHRLPEHLLGAGLRVQEHTPCHGRLDEVVQLPRRSTAPQPANLAP